MTTAQPSIIVSRGFASWQFRPRADRASRGGVNCFVARAPRNDGVGLRVACVLLPLLLAACGSPLTPADFAGTVPKLRPEQWFAGHVRSFGVWENGNGAPLSRFSTDSTGTLAPDGVLTMAQTVHLADGSTVQRTWHLHATGPHDYVATAAPVIGTAAGQAYGRAFHWQYDYALKPHDWLRTVHFDHWMYLSDDGKTLLNRIVVTKLGVTVARASEIFQHVQ